MLITHVDDALKYRMVRDSLKRIEVSICMSRMTVDLLVGEGIPNDRICSILPANDKRTSPRRIVIGIPSHLYPDGRKREFLLARLAQEMDLSPFHFEVFGRNWEKTAEQLRAGGATVAVTDATADYAGHYAAMCARIPHFDYYFYMGLDEGSMGVLDALDAGIPTIITPQGFHVDIPHAITHPFVDYPEMRTIFAEIAKGRAQRLAAAASLSWTEHARRHLELWTAMVEGRRTEFMARERTRSLLAPASTSLRQRSSFQRMGDYLKLGNQYRWNMLKRYYLPKVKRRVERGQERLGLNPKE